jgi:hypothetical protein
LLPESQIERESRCEGVSPFFSEEQSPIGRDGYLDLSRQGDEIQRLQIVWPAWEPTVIAKKHQPCLQTRVGSLGS